MEITCQLSAGEILTAFIAVVGLGFVWWQVRAAKQQITLQNFSDYTKRYQEIILRFPEDVNSPDFILKDRKDYPQTMRYMRAYVDLCYEEWWLHQQGYVKSDIWDVWRGGIKTALSKTAFQQAWNKIRKDSKYGSEFEAFLDQCMSLPKDE